MPRFTILPTDQAYSSAEITALDAGAVLNIISHLDCGEADVLQDGAYSFSVRLDPSGMWAIFHRGRTAKAEEIPSLG